MRQPIFCSNLTYESLEGKSTDFLRRSLHREIAGTEDSVKSKNSYEYMIYHLKVFFLFASIATLILIYQRGHFNISPFNFKH